jgi:hypothetical protein
MQGARVLLAIACTMALFAGALAVPASGADLFEPSSYVEKPLAADAPIDPNSDTMVRALKLEFDLQYNDPDVRNKPAVDNHWCTPHLYTVPADQPYVPVTLYGGSEGNPTAVNQIGSVPIPSYATTARFDECWDLPMTIHQPSTDSTWDLIGAKKENGNWMAHYGGLITSNFGQDGLSKNPGHWEDPPAGFGRGYGATATSIPRMAGLPRLAELTAGEIDHVVGFTMRAPAPCFRYPAQRQDGRLLTTYPQDAVARAQSHPLEPQTPPNNNALAPPEGAILRLPASLDIDALGLPRFTKTLAKAVQKYGLILTDRSNQVSIGTEKPPAYTNIPGHGNDPNPYTEGPDGMFGGPDAIFEGKPAYELMGAFPWDKLQVLAVKPGKEPCQT